MESYFFRTGFAACFFLLLTVSQGFTGDDERALAEMLNTISRDMNKSCPEMLSENLRSDYFFVEGTVLVHKTTFIAISRDSFDFNEFINGIDPLITAEICKLKSWVKVVDAGATISQFFHDKDDVYVGRVDVTKKKCKRFNP